MAPSYLTFRPCLSDISLAARGSELAEPAVDRWPKISAEKRIAVAENRTQETTRILIPEHFLVQVQAVCFSAYFFVSGAADSSAPPARPPLK
jgi:hypothetical protein